MSGNFIPEFPSMKSPILARTHRQSCRLLNLPQPQAVRYTMAYGLHDKLITVTRAVQIYDAKMCKQNHATNVLFLKF